MRTVLLALALVSAATGARAGPVDDIRSLFESGRARDAAELGRRHPQLLGQPEFDYFYGMALIDAGDPAAGVLALERHLLHRPDSQKARAELGRGYFLMGDYPRSREMFNELLAKSPPADLKAKAEEFLAAIRQRESAWRTSWTGFLEGGGGHDNNVNSGIDSDILNIPLFGAVAIDPAGRRQADRFLGVAGGAQVNVPLGATWSAFAALGADARRHRDQQAFDQRNANATAGISLRRGDQQWRASLGAGRLDVDGDKYRTLGVVTLDAEIKTSATRRLAAYAQLADIRYDGDNRVRDARLNSLGAQWSESFESRWQPMLTLGLNGGRENNRRDRDDLGRRLYGVFASTALTFTPRWGTALTAQYQRSRYGAEDVFFMARRDDRYRSVEWTLGHALGRDLSARLEVARASNDSTIALYEYTRTQFALKLRHDFR